MPLTKSKYDWLFKYKLYHLPFWFAYHYLWWTLAIGSVWEVAHSIFFSLSSIKFAFYVAFQALGVYFNLYFLIPRFLEKGRYIPYVSLLIFTIAGTATCIVTGYYTSAWLSEQTFQELWGIAPENYFHFFKANALPSTVASTTLAMSIKLTKNWIHAKRREKLLEKEKLETELKFLKSQFNPHFLFNTINSIFVLIHKNPTLASEALAKFSDLLRYQLYECNEHEISLRQELLYLENFIELEKLRQDTDTLTITVEIQQPNHADLTIAPFVLIPFIENAFKHVSNRKDHPNQISIELQCNHHQLCFSVANSISRQEETSQDIFPAQGIGLKNVQRRLDLIYPGEHELSIQQNDEQFRVALQLDLHISHVSQPMALPVA